MAWADERAPPRGAMKPWRDETWCDTPQSLRIEHLATKARAQSCTITETLAIETLAIETLAIETLAIEKDRPYIMNGTHA